MNTKIPFLITIDTEGDSLWGYNGKSKITINNIDFLPRFQKLCDKYLFKPTWLVNYEMANEDKFVEFGKKVLATDTGEIGMHLHAWNSPPVEKLNKDDKENQSYLIEFPLHIMEEKIIFLTNLLKNKFQTDIISHRSGRWAFNEQYASLLIKNGYKVDCSVTPFVSWKKMKGGRIDSEGSDYTYFPSKAYFINDSNISKEGNSKLLEIPMSILPTFSYKYENIVNKLPKILKRICNRLYPSTVWLRPNGKNLKEMKGILDNARKYNLNYVEFMIHSSEFMPGGSPYFKDEKSVEKLYKDLEDLMIYAQKQNFIGMTMKEFYNQINSN